MSPWVFVVRERNVRAYEHVVLDSNAGRNEDKWSNFTIVTDAHAFLDIDVGVDLRVFSDLASIQIYEIVNSRVFSKPGLLYDRKLWVLGHLTRTPSATGNFTGTVLSFLIDSRAASSRVTT